MQHCIILDVCMYVDISPETPNSLNPTCIFASIFGDYDVTSRPNRLTDDVVVSKWWPKWRSGSTRLFLKYMMLFSQHNLV